MPRRQSCLNRRAVGTCTSCTKPAAPGRTHCQSCIDENNAYTKKRRDDRRAAGLCLQCGKPAQKDRVYCVEHTEQKRVAALGKHLKQYKLTREEFDARLAAQGYRCKICGSPTPRRKNRDWHVDHNHKTEEIRGLLCHPCNIGLGLFGDSPERLRAAATYLEKDGAV